MTQPETLANHAIEPTYSASDNSGVMGVCLADFTGDESVNVTDLHALLTAWGLNPGHAADTNFDESVNVTDLLALLAAWGACP